MKKLIVLLSIFCISLHAKDLISDRTIIEGELENGFKYTIKHNEKPKQKASFRLVVKVGSNEEDEDQRGVAHLVEHLAFNGTEHFKDNSLVQFLESLGVDFGSHLNASTSFTETIYQLEVPLKKDNLEKSMLVFSDWAGGIVMTQKELDKERGVVLEEKRARNSSVYRIYEKMHKFMYKGSRFEKRLPIGLEKVIKEVSLKRVKDFYTTWYQPRFMHFVAVGDFDVKKMQEFIEKNFSHLKNINRKKLYSKKVKAPKGTKIEVLKDKEVVKMSANLFFVDRYKKMKNEQDYKKEFIISIIEKLFALKAQELSLLKNPSAKDVRFNASPIGDNLVYFMFKASFVKKEGQKAYVQMLNLIEDIKQNGFGKRDFEIVKKDILASNEHELKNLKNRTSGSFAREIAYYKANDEIFVDIKYASELEKKLLQTITLEDINKVFRKITSLKNRFSYFVVPNDYEVSKKQIKNALKNAPSNVKKNNLHVNLPNDIKTKKLIPTEVVFQKYNKEFDFYEFVLKNGVKIVYKFNDYEKDKVAFGAYSKGGFSLYDNDKFYSAKKSATLINNSGLGEYNFLHVKKIYADKIVELSSFIDRYFEGFTGSSSSSDFKHLLKRVYLSAVDFRLDKNVLFNSKIDMIELLNKEKNSPYLSYKYAFEKFYFDNNPRFTKIDEEGIKRINEDDVLSVYKDRFSDFNNFTFFIIGDVKKEEVLKYSKKYLGNLPTKKRDETYKDRGIRHISGKHEFVKNLNNENISRISFTYTKPIPYSLENKIRLRALADVLQTKLMEFIREEKSGVYGVMVHDFLEREPVDEIIIKIGFACDPKRKDELIGYVKKIINELQEKKVEQKYINAFIKKSSVMIDEKSSKNDYWLYILEKSYKYGDKLLSVDEYKNLYGKITPKILQQSAKDFFDTKNVILSQLNPIKK